MAPDDPLDSLLQSLAQGDEQAAERVFRTFEPILRMMVRRKLSPVLRTRFDSIDIVQSVWGDLLDGFRAGRFHFDTSEQLRAFLFQVTRNRLIDHVRHEKSSLRHERSIAREHLELLFADKAFPVEAELEAEELWRQLLSLCPSQHRSLLELKRQGLSLTVIAERTGLHESSVRRILYELADRFAARAPTHDA